LSNADDSLFEPLSGPIRPTIFASGIMKRADATAIEIIPANPKQLYIDAANEVIDYAVKCYPQMHDVRIPSVTINFRLPTGALRLDTLVDRFHSGSREFWVSAPGLTAPRQFEFAGRFGHFKVWRFAQQVLMTRTAQIVADWFWIDSTEGQLSAIELGIILKLPALQSHHVFGNKTEAQAYYAQ
jgi:hypothetical protein